MAKSHMNAILIISILMVAIGLSAIVGLTAGRYMASRDLNCNIELTSELGQR